MPTTFSVQLPDGTIVDGVPEGTTQVELYERLANTGGITPEQAISYIEQGAKEQPEAPFDLGDWAIKNLDLPGGIAGAVTGALAGSMAGPVGSVIGGIAGGAAGTFGGSLASDYYTDNELDYEKAVKESLVSVGIDVATLGLGKALKPVIKRAFASKLPVDAATEEALRHLQETQRMLNKGGATLTPTQTGRAGRLASFMERVSNLGILSKQVMEGNAQKVNQVISGELDNIVAKEFSTEQLGRTLFDTITVGREANSALYQQSLDDLKPLLTQTAVNTQGFRQTMRNVLKGGLVKDLESNVLANKLDDDTVKFLNKYLDIFDEAPQMSANALLDIYKKMTKEITEKGNFGSPGFNSVASRELADVQSKISGALEREFLRRDKTLAKKFATMQAGFREGQEGLLPKNLSRIVANGRKENWDAIGAIASRSGNTDEVRSMLKSIDTAHALASKAGIKSLRPKEDILRDLRTGYIRSKMPELGTEAFNTKAYSKLLKESRLPQENSKLKTILGKDYGNYMMILRAMDHASEIASSGAGSLVFQSKQFGALAVLLGYLTGGTGGAAGAAAVLGTPWVLAKMITHPKYSSTLLGLTRMKAPSEAALAKASIILNDVMGEFINDQDVLTPEERALARLKMMGGE